MANNGIEAREQHLETLCDAFLALRNSAEAKAFLIDLCTPAELRALAERWHVARLLNKEEYSYRDISQMTGVSTTTIGRVARFMSDEPYQGYTTILERQRKKNK